MTTRAIEFRTYVEEIEERGERVLKVFELTVEGETVCSYCLVEGSIASFTEDLLFRVENKPPVHARFLVRHCAICTMFRERGAKMGEEEALQRCRMLKRFTEAVRAAVDGKG